MPARRSGRHRLSLGDRRHSAGSPDAARAHR